ncbi:hypothetical protein MXM33_03355 [Acinetobacter vivianii]|uniref:hypothetical protein n=1 Tax=Acinetobacter vivianii TaxID=1776742 RepID=UPI002DB8A90E|nr:hypothetical protein [Acinetobacter vivianii]MEB6666070.1 hypothetical protein [Acinetobacter vivianii]
MSGCVTIAKLPKPQQDKYFILEKNYMKKEIRGIAKYEWVMGLSAGTYKLIGEDKNGFYFSGTGDCVLLLINENAKHYLTDGVVPSYKQRYDQQMTFAGGIGGIFIPKASNKQPKFFYEVHGNRESAALTGGIIGLALIDITNNAITFISYNTPSDILSKIDIKSGPITSSECKNIK